MKTAIQNRTPDPPMGIEARAKAAYATAHHAQDPLGEIMDRILEMSDLMFHKDAVNLKYSAILKDLREPASAVTRAQVMSKRAMVMHTRLIDCRSHDDLEA